MKSLTSLFKTNEDISNRSSYVNEDIFNTDISHEIVVDLSHESDIKLTKDSIERVTISRESKPLYSLDLNYNDIKKILELTVAKEIHFSNPIYYNADEPTGYNFTLSSDSAISINLPGGFCIDSCKDHITLIAPKVSVTQNDDISNYDIKADYAEFRYNRHFKKFDSKTEANEVFITLDWDCKKDFKFNDGVPNVFNKIDADLIIMMFKYKNIDRSAYIFCKNEKIANDIYKRFTGGFKMFPPKKVNNCWGLNASILSEWPVGTTKYYRAAKDITRFVTDKCFVK